MIQFLLALDQVFNTLWFIQGDEPPMADEAISARAFRCHIQGLLTYTPVRCIDFFFGEGHCYRAWLAEFDRRQLPSHYR